VERLERLLAPLGHRASTPLVAAPARRWPVAAAAALLVGWGVALAVLATRGTPPDATPAEAAAIRVHAEGAGDVAPGDWVEAEGAPRVVRFGDVGSVTLEPGARLRVARAAEDRTRFFLERGRLEAVVSASARPRFFEVETPAVRCVDLGCHYVLDVDPAGTSRVHVTTGQVAFETPAREVYVPAGAVCLARRGAAPGTPRFEDAPAPLVAEVDAYDAAAVGSDERRARAGALLAEVRDGRDALPAWHLLADPDARVARAAFGTLSERFGAPVGASSETFPLDRLALDAWKEHLAAVW
jgi:hypothetical protein